jgi:two-component system response regulator FixJ
MEWSTRLVHILDDDVAVRHALARLVSIAGYEVSTYETPLALIAALPTIALGCLLLDIRLPTIDGLALQQMIPAGRLAVIPMTGHGDIDMAVRAMRTGAVDFLEKPFTDDRLIAALERGFALLEALPRDPDTHEAGTRVATLSPRERQVLRGLAAGQSNKLIARDLAISVRTVEVHRAHMLRRLGVAHLAEAIRLQVLADLAG